MSICDVELIGSRFAVWSAEGAASLAGNKRLFGDSVVNAGDDPESAVKLPHFLSPVEVYFAFKQGLCVCRTGIKTT